MLKRAIFAATRPQFDNRPSFSTRAFRNGLEEKSNQQSFLYILYKFGEIRITDPGIEDVTSCTAGVENFNGVTLVTFSRGRGCWALR